jgi:sulfate adenylyltransferase subunit 2
VRVRQRARGGRRAFALSAPDGEPPERGRGGSSSLAELTELEDESLYVIREAYARFRRPAVLWSMGKDSTALLHLCRQAFLGTIPFPVVHLDTGHKFPEMLAQRSQLSAEWGFELVVARNEAAMRAGVGPAQDTLECCTALKTRALEAIVLERRFDALLLAIRRDEHAVRAKERVFSPRDRGFRWAYGDQPLEVWSQYASTQGSPEATEARDGGQHVRVHPLLHWRERDVWRLHLRDRLPVNPLYFAREGRRYRSLGCMPCTAPVASTAATIEQILDELDQTTAAERAGRLQDKERSFMMQKLRALGYM